MASNLEGKSRVVGGFSGRIKGRKEQTSKRVRKERGGVINLYLSLIIAMK